MRRLTVAILVLGSVLAAQKLRAKGTDMEIAHNVSIPELTEALSSRLVAQWEAWKNQDAASNNAIIADDFNFLARWLPPRGKAHLTADVRAAHYRVQTVTVARRDGGSGCGPGHLLRPRQTPSDNVEHQMAVGEVWVKGNGQWLIRGYSGTLMK
jgi:hypothetical protein